MNRFQTVLGTVGTTSILVFILVACTIPAVFPTCRLPSQITERDIQGEWVADYSGVYISNPLPGTLVISDTSVYLNLPNGESVPKQECNLFVTDSARLAWGVYSALQGEPYKMDGKESFVFDIDNEYVQQFGTDAHSNWNSSGNWELVLDAIDSPKIRVTNARYFAEGASFSTGENPFRLSPPNEEFRRIQSENLTPVQQSSLSVVYPDSEYLYLYPRKCGGDLVLQQMVMGVQDPDEGVMTVPAFRKVKN